MSKACVFLANGLEECEGLVTIDILRRAGVEVTTASIHEDKLISSSHNISFILEIDALAFVSIINAIEIIIRDISI